MKRSLSLSPAALTVAALAIIAVGLLTGLLHPPSAADGLLIGFGGIIVNRDSLNAMYNGFKTAYNDAFAGVAPMWGKVATLVPSTSKTENYGWLGQFPKLREWVGDRQVKGIAASGYQIINKKYEASIGVPRDDIEDDSYGILTPLFASMGQAAASHPDELVFPLLSAGWTTRCFDGQYFFDANHPVGAGVVSNNGGGSGSAWFLLDTSRPLRPIIFQKRRDYALTSLTDTKDEGVWMRDEYRYGVDARANVGYGFWQMAYGSKQTLDATNFNAAIAAMMAYASDDGRPLGITPNLLVVAPSNRAAAKALIEAERLASGGSNTNFKAVELYICPWLT
ncbi:Mu-like prophage major head subunit gpT family protein [Accumulibacter sp.]|uniref:Mu-like prophage major head subunit gpT family protein n=1 Tax=Accumulibacter sp. TaxID=2053492 RepID=UPI001AD04D74|nr:Mu-like prophage major head subunit gpT family protein [Accumulibacter sp.]MBN8516227.1 Mu-like prophage major head subunit gpT family protein [Accumulibacter sp.]MBO3704274.1 Mu-like prophage major head subunit gpT family protein [Accumulibacter sp.]